jgi:uncharacterized caspase-like protein
VVGVDQYEEANLRLRYAKSDALRLAQALKAPRGNYYAAVEVTTLVDATATAAAITSSVTEALSRSSPGDTVLFYFAGHGVRGDGERYYLTPYGFHSNRIAETGLAWSQLAIALSQSKVRVIVLLDACHSGFAGSQGSSTSNDAAVAALLRGTSAPIVVFAAAKGRQYSFEDGVGRPPRWGGGVFTHALVRALSKEWQANDTNKNGALEISELYRAVKSIVVGQTGGEQTPWLVRQDMVGDFAIF